MTHPGRLATAFAQQASREGASKLTVPAFADTVDAPKTRLPRRRFPSMGPKATGMSTMVTVRDQGASLDRRFLAVLCADVAGYSRLMDLAEEDTHRRLMSLLSSVFVPVVDRHGGRIVKTTGDGFLASFDGAGNAVRCAIELQDRVAEVESEHPPADRILLRIGVTVDNVIVEAHDIFGGAVNTAARLQQIAEPGGIVVSSTVLDHVRDQIDLRSYDLGSVRLKNIHGPTHAFAIMGPSVERLSVSAKFSGKPWGKVSGRSSGRRTHIPSIAVMPFRTLGSRPNEEYFAQGVIEDITGALSSLRDLMVIWSGSTSGLVGDDRPPAAIGKQLGVRYILTGTVRRTSGAVRISTALTDVRAGTVLWADHMDGKLKSIFDLQDRIATQIVGTIALTSARRSSPAPSASDRRAWTPTTSSSRESPSSTGWTSTNFSARAGSSKARSRRTIATPRPMPTRPSGTSSTSGRDGRNTPCRTRSRPGDWHPPA